MTNAQFVAFFVWPFVVLAFAVVMYWLTGWQDRREGFRREGERRAAAVHASSGSSPSSAIPNPDRPT